MDRKLQLELLEPLKLAQSLNQVSRLLAFQQAFYLHKELD